MLCVLFSCVTAAWGVVAQKLVNEANAEIDDNIKKRRQEDDAAFLKIDEEVSVLTK